MAKVAITPATIAACKKIMDSKGVKASETKPAKESAILILQNGILTHATVSEDSDTIAFVEGKATGIAIVEYIPNKILMDNIAKLKPYIAGLRFCKIHGVPRKHVGQTHSRCESCDVGYKATAAAKRADAQAERLASLLEDLI